MEGSNASFLPFSRVVDLPGVHAPLQRTALALFGAWCAFTTFFFGSLFLYMQRRDLQPIKSRMPNLCALSAVFGWACASVHAYEAFYTGPEQWPCWVRHWTIWVLIPGTFVAYPWRAFRLIMVARLADWIAYHHQNTMTIAQSFRSMTIPKTVAYSNPMRAQKKGTRGTAKSNATSKAKAARKKSAAGTKTKAKDLDLKDSSLIRIPSKNLTSSAFNMTNVASASGAKQREAKSHKRRSVAMPKPDDVVVGFFACCHNPGKAVSASSAVAHIKALRLHIRWTVGYVATVMLVFSIAALVTHIIVPQNAMYGCVMPNIHTAITNAVCIGLVVATNVALMIVLVYEGISDNFSIRAELFIITICMLLFVVPYIVYTFQIRHTCGTVLEQLPISDPQDAPADIFWQDCIWITLSDWSMFMWVVTSYCTSIGWPLWQSLAQGAQVLRREDDTRRSLKRRIPRNTWKALESLKATLEDPHSREAFFEFLKSEFSPENLLFYDACEAFRTQMYWPSDDAKFDAAQRLYMKFIKPNKAPFEVNLPSKMRAPLDAQFDVAPVKSSPGKGDGKSVSRTKSMIAKDHDGTEVVDYTNSVSSTMEISSRVFVEAQQEIFALMESDSFARFKRTESGKTMLVEKTKLQSWNIASEEAHLV